MWCHGCQQDVPAVASVGEARQVCCARCGEAMPRRDAATDGSEEIGAVDAPPADASLMDLLRNPLSLDDYRDWKLEDELREAERLVRTFKAQRPSHAPLEEQAAATRSAPANSPKQKPSSDGGSTLAWGLSGLGLAGMVCGCALLVWSVVVQRDALWTIGLPIALVSMVVLVCGLLLRRDGEEDATGEGQGESRATYVQVESSVGGMQPSGLSVHFANASAPSQSLDADRLRREIETVVQRRRAA